MIPGRGDVVLEFAGLFLEMAGMLFELGGVDLKIGAAVLDVGEPDRGPVEGDTEGINAFAVVVL